MRFQNEKKVFKFLRYSADGTSVSLGQKYHIIDSEETKRNESESQNKVDFRK